MKIRGRRKLLLTGTPLQNNLVELMSLLIFVMPGMFAKKKEQLKKMFSLFPKTQDESERCWRQIGGGIFMREIFAGPTTRKTGSHTQRGS